jgi:hypothetical protein
MIRNDLQPRDLEQNRKERNQRANRKKKTEKPEIG